MSELSVILQCFNLMTSGMGHLVAKINHTSLLLFHISVIPKYKNRVLTLVKQVVLYLLHAIAIIC